MIGQIVSRYRILESLDKGGMGEVYLAEDPKLRRQVAIKFAAADRDDRAFRARFKREAEIAASFSHPNIAAVYDYGETVEGRPFIVMEWVRGHSLHHYLSRNELTPTQRVNIVADVAAALSEAHQHGIIHRDIKPANIVITTSGQVKVLDFGIAKQLIRRDTLLEFASPSAATYGAPTTVEGALLGTPHYMSPEQARGASDEADVRSDLFALGIVLYQCLTNRLPFNGATIIEVCSAVLHVHPPPPSTINPQISVELDRLTLKALAKAPGDRYQSAAALRQALLAAPLIKHVELPVSTYRTLALPHQPDEPPDVPIANTQPVAPPTGFQILHNTESQVAPTPTNSVIPLPTEAVDSHPITPGPIAPALAHFRRASRKPREAKPIFAAEQNQPSSPSRVKTLVILFALLLFIAIALLRFQPWRMSPGTSSVVTKQPPSAAVTKYQQGLTALRDGAFFTAKQALEQALTLAPDFTLAHARLAEALMELDYADEAKSRLLRASKLMLKQPQLSALERAHLQAIISTVERESDKAIAAYRQVTSLTPAGEKAAAHFDLARAYERDERAAEAQQEYQVAIQADPQTVAAHLRLGSLYSRQGNRAEAEAAFKRAETLYQRNTPPNLEGVAEVCYRRGSLYVQLKQWPAARRELERAETLARALNSKTLVIKTALQMSVVLCAENKFDLAKQRAANATELARQAELENLTAQGLLTLGNAFYRADKDAEAETYYNQALAIAQRQGGRLAVATAHANLGNLHLFQKKFEQSAGELTEALGYFEKNHYRIETIRANLLLAKAKLALCQLLAANQLYQTQIQQAQTAGDQSLAERIAQERINVQQELKKAGSKCLQ